MKNALKIVFVIIGTLIGAGFASGKEIYIFFAKYGIYGIIGILISTTLTALIISKTLKIIKKYNINSYKEFLQKINKKGNKIINYIVNTFLLVTFFIMIAGFSAYIKQKFSINEYISSTIFILICYIVLTKNIKGVIKINEILMPILILFTIYIGIKNIPYIIKLANTNLNMNANINANINTNISQNINATINSNINTNAFIGIENSIQASNICTYIIHLIKVIISSILYASYNSIILIPVLTSLKKYIQKEKAITIITWIILNILALLIYGLLLRGINYAQNLEMPLIQIVEEFGKTSKIIYEIIIVVAIFTSAISTSYSFLENVTKETNEKNQENKNSHNIKNIQKNSNSHRNQNYKKILKLICIIGIIVSKIGFSNLMQILYPLFGILGLIQIAKITVVQIGKNGTIGDSPQLCKLHKIK